MKLLEQLHTEVEKYSHFENKLKDTVAKVPVICNDRVSAQFYEMWAGGYSDMVRV